MDSKKEIYYYAKEIPAEDLNFEDFELIQMGIQFVRKFDEVTKAMKKIEPNFNEGDDLGLHGYTVAKIGSLEEDFWAVYDIDLTFKKVLDYFDKVNFYNIYKNENGFEKLVFHKVYLTENNVQEELVEYVNIAEDFKDAQLGINEFLN